MEAVEVTSADIKRLISFFHRAWKEAGPKGLGFTGATKETIDEVASEEFLKDRLSNRNVEMYLAEDMGNVLGFAATKKIDEDTIELSGIMVLESVTRKGVGTVLFERVMLAAMQGGFRKIVVKTETINQRAISFYQKRGLCEVGRTREDVGAAKVDLVVLEKILR